MAKFLKSIFNTAERRKAPLEEDVVDERTETPPMDSRRQLSISRSGRMKQANKIRHSLSLELYGDTIHIDPIKKQGHIEYHVHGPVSQTAPAALGGKNNRLDAHPEIEVIVPSNMEVENTFEVSLETKLKSIAIETGCRSPEEEIDYAFDIIDKS